MAKVEIRESKWADLGDKNNPVVLNLGQFRPSRDIWQILETLFVVTTGKGDT